MKAVIYILVKFPKLTVLNLTKLGPWEAGSIVKKVLLAYGIVNELSIS